MSSFIIDKWEYMKMAGAIAGICHDFGSCGMTEDDIIDSAERIYMENVKSVNMQYGTNIEPDRKKYIKEYNTAYNGTRWADIGFQMMVENNIIGFLRSVMYQIENEECAKKVSVEICEIVFAMNRAIGVDNGMWGQFNVRKEDNNA